MRGLELKLTTRPKWPAPMSLIGLSTLEGFSRLEKSAWKCRSLDSVIGMSLATEKSTLL